MPALFKLLSVTGILVALIPTAAAAPLEVILMRHADKDRRRGDYNLSPAGFERAINLARMLRPAPEGGEDVDWERLAGTVRLGVRFLDNVIEVNRHPTPAIEGMSRATRKLGLGVMGFAEMLLRLGLAYGGPESVTSARTRPRNSW